MMSIMTSSFTPAQQTQEVRQAADMPFRSDENRTFSKYAEIHELTCLSVCETLVISTGAGNQCLIENFTSQTT